MRSFHTRIDFTHLTILNLLERGYHFFLYSGFVLLPFFYWPWAPVTHEVPKVFVTLIWIDILIILSVLFSLISPKKKQNNLNPLVVVTAILLFAWIVFASFVGSDWNKSVFGNYYRIDGLVTAGHLIAFSFTFGLMSNQQTIKRVLLSILISSVGLSCFTIVSALKESKTLSIMSTNFFNFISSGASSSFGFGSNFGNPNFLGGYLLVTLPIVWRASHYLHFPVHLPSLPKLKEKIPLFFVIFALFLTHSRSAVLGIVLTPLLYWASLSKKNVGILLGLFVSLVIVGSFFINSYLITNGQFLPNEHRLVITKRMALAIEQKPITGWGWSNVNYAVAAHRWPHNKITHDIYVDKAHGIFLEYLVATGIIGFALFAFLVGITTWNIWSLAKQSTRNTFSYQLFLFLQITWLLYLYHAQTNVISISEEILFWMIVGIGMTYNQDNQGLKTTEYV